MAGKTKPETYFTPDDGTKYIRADVAGKTAAMSTEKNPLTFSQKVAVVFTVIAVVCVAAGILLPVFGVPIDYDFIKWIFPICVAEIGGYMGKSFAEKHSRNKAGVDENGNKIGGNENHE